MTEHDLIFAVRIVFLTVAIVMIVQARVMFNGMARGQILLAAALIVRSINDMFGILDTIGLATLSSIVAGVYLYDVWTIWKDRKDHAEYVHWREQWAEELKLIHQWQNRKAERDRLEQELEEIRALDEGVGSWDHQITTAKQTRGIGLKRN